MGCRFLRTLVFSTFEICAKRHVQYLIVLMRNCSNNSQRRDCCLAIAVLTVYHENDAINIARTTAAIANFQTAVMKSSVEPEQDNLKLRADDV